MTRRLIGLIAAIVLATATVAAVPRALQVAEAKLGTGIENREIVNEATTFAVEISRHRIALISLKILARYCGNGVAKIGLVRARNERIRRHVYALHPLSRRKQHHSLDRSSRRCRYSFAGKTEDIPRCHGVDAAQGRDIVQSGIEPGRIAGPD